MAYSKSSNNSNYNNPLPPHTKMSIKQSKRHSNRSIPKIITILIIIVATLSVASVSIYYFLAPTPEEATMSQLDQLASNYYEQYYYDKFANSEAFQSLEDVDSAMDKYVKTGFSRVTLRQLLVYNRSTTKPLSNQVLKYCDEEKTFVVFYPESPFERTSYHTKFTYSCAF